MKTNHFLLAMLLLLSANVWNLNAQEDNKVTAYCYVTCTGDLLPVFYTDVFSVQRDEDNQRYSTDISNEFNDALKLASPKNYYKYKYPIVWMFDKVSDAEKHKRESLGEYKSKEREIRYIRFTFYGDK